MADLSRYADEISAACKNAFYSARDNGGTMHTAGDDASNALLAPGGIIDRIVTEALAEQRARVEALANEYARMNRVPPYQDGITVADSILAALDGDTEGES